MNVNRTLVIILVLSLFFITTNYVYAMISGPARCKPGTVGDICRKTGCVRGARCSGFRGNVTTYTPPTSCSINVTISPRPAQIEASTPVNLTAGHVLGAKIAGLEPNNPPGPYKKPPVPTPSYTYAWSSTCGSFTSGQNSQTATWKSPSSLTTCKVTAAVTKTISGVSCSDTDYINVGVVNPAISWYTSVNGDVFAAHIVNEITYRDSTPGGFKTMLLNVTSSNKTGSYLRSAGDVISAEGNKTIFDAGSGDKKSGYAKSLYDDDNPSSYPASYWLEQFFDPYTIPTGSYVKKITKISQINKAGIYKMSDSDFNSNLSANVTYSLGSNDAAVLYIDGNHDLDIKGTIKGNAGSARLIIITPGNVYISKSIGITPITSYTINSSSIIDVGIISGGSIGIVFDGVAYLDHYDTPDIPIVASSPLVSINEILFKRELGMDNVDYPAESVKYDPTLLYYFTNFERSHGETLTYSGISTFDVQWVYEE